MDLAMIQQECHAAEYCADYEAVDVLWVSLLKLANRMPGTNEHRRVLAMVDELEDPAIKSVLVLKAVDRLLDLKPPLETVLADPNERLEPEATQRSIETVRQHRNDEPRAAL